VTGGEIPKPIAGFFVVVILFLFALVLGVLVLVYGMAFLIFFKFILR